MFINDFDVPICDAPQFEMPDNWQDVQPELGLSLLNGFGPLTGESIAQENLS